MTVFKVRKKRGKQDLHDSGWRNKTIWIKNKINPTKTNISNQKIYLESTSKVPKMQAIMDHLINHHFLIILIMILREVEDLNKEKKDLLHLKHSTKLKIILTNLVKDSKDLGLIFFPKSNNMI
jgi:hypothetical protein